MSTVVEVEGELTEEQWTTVLFAGLEERDTLKEEVAGLRRDLHHFSHLLAERVQRPGMGGEWLNTSEAARMLGMTVKGVYCSIARNSTGLLAQSVVKVGGRMRFSREKIEALLTSGLKNRTGRALIDSRASSSRRNNG